MSADVLDRFSPITQTWFRGAFVAPTAAQAGAWNAISSGHDALVVAPTGSGKTLAAFLWALDRVASTPPPAERMSRCRVLYISPLKALAVDVERNLRSPLVGMRRAAERLGLPTPEVSVAVRSGDTSAADRRAFAKTPADVLITTPESLYLLLTSNAREALAGVETVIIDEVHAVAGTKRGAHLALSLERLDALVGRRTQRVGLSATVSPVEEVARFLSGGRPVEIVNPPSDKQWQIDVVVPVPDLAALDEAGQDSDDPAASASIWPHVEERIVDLIASHTSTLVFCNSRRLAERLTARINEIWTERQEAHAADVSDDRDPPAPQASRPAPAGSRPPAQMMGQAGASHGSEPVLARAHHGSVSKEHRAQIEEALKTGNLRAVVATSSLELGIDMGAVDLVIQVESPPSVASGLQRVGRAGHHVGAASHGVIFPKYRGDLIQTAVVAERMLAGQIEPLRIIEGPLDVLAQQLVAMVALDEVSVQDLYDTVRGAASFTGLKRTVFDSVLDMLAGKYPSEDFAELRPRIVWDRVTDLVTGRRGAQRLAVTNAGTIPDRGLFPVFLASGEGPGRRVGELDEEMVYESRVGDSFTLGSSTWRIEDITHDRVLVTPAPGLPGRLPFWHGDSPSRPVALGEAIGGFLRDIGHGKAAAARARVASTGLDAWATDNVLSYVGEQREAAGHLPTDQGIVIERFRDELGDWRIAVHSIFGGAVHGPWALCIAARMRERFGTQIQASHSDDGLVFRLPDVEFDDGDGADTALGEGRSGTQTDIDAELLAAIIIDPDEVEALVTAELGGSALFASRFRECAARALLLPRRRPGQRQALWQQRQRSAALLEVAASHPTFPIVHETVRECLQDVFDVPALINLMRRIQQRQISTVSVASRTPSPFARALLFGYVAQYLYEGDSPLAERRAAALSLDPALLADVLGRGESFELRDLLDPVAVTRTEHELQHLDPTRGARGPEDLLDLLRTLGPLTLADIASRTVPEARAQVADWLAGLTGRREVIAVRIADEDRYAASLDAARLQDALGVALPVGLPDAYLEPVPDPLGDLVLRYARTHGPFTATEVAAHYGLGVAPVRQALKVFVASGRVVHGALRPRELSPPQHLAGPDGIPDLAAEPAQSLSAQQSADDYCDAEVLRILRRRSLAALRADVEPVSQSDLARFGLAWQSIGGEGERLHGVEGVYRAVEQLGGALVPASALETLVLPSRVSGYSPAHLDELLARGEVTWAGHAEVGRSDGWVSLHLTETAPLTLPLVPSADTLTDQQTEVLAALEGGGAYFIDALRGRVGLSERDLATTLWELVWLGLIANDTITPLRELVDTSTRRSARTPRTRPVARYGSSHRASLRSLAAHAAATAPGAASQAGGHGLTGSANRGATSPRVHVPLRSAGRWLALPPREENPTLRAIAAAECLLDRHGLVTRGAVAAADVPGGFGTIYRVLSDAEQMGRVRRGYFVEGLGASQFGTTAAVDRLRVSRSPLDLGPSLEGEAEVNLGTGQGIPAGSGMPISTGAAHVESIVLAAADPANPYGAALPWPTLERVDESEGRGHQPSRSAGGVVVLRAGEPVFYLERGGKSLLSFTDDSAALASGARALANAMRAGALGRLTVQKADGQTVLSPGHPVATALAEAGFILTPRGLRVRR